MTERHRQTLIPLLIVGIILSSVGVALYVPVGGKNSPIKEFVVNEGDGSSKVARLLAQEGLVRSRHLFVLYAVFTGQEKNIKAGRYLLSPAMSIPEILSLMTRGLSESDDIVVTIPEGFNVWEIDHELAGNGLIRAGDFFQRAWGKEGTLFPDTYRLTSQKLKIKSQKEENLITELMAKMEENFGAKGGGIDREHLIVASLLEKEVQKTEDMALVAGIIYKRLDLKMPLQVDASVAYGACLEQMQNSKIPASPAGRKSQNEALVSWGCDVTQVNLIKWIKIDGPHNTYTRTGLPVGPISNPGLRAINAAQHPQASDYLYYLSARDGRTIFSKTAEEHERNRRRYLNM